MVLFGFGRGDDAAVESLPQVGAFAVSEPGLVRPDNQDRVFVDEERVRSSKPSTLTRERDTFAGDTLDYDDKTGIALLTGKVHCVLQPAESESNTPEKQTSSPAT